MIDRIRTIRLQKGLTLADVAAACAPPTTPQTIGRLETGARTLSLDWMNRIAAALGVEPASLLREETREPARLVAQFGPAGLQALPAPLDILPPNEIDPLARWVVLRFETACAEYRPADQIWLRHLGARALAPASSQLVNRLMLVPLPGGRLAFGRLVSLAPASEPDEHVLTLLPALDQRPPLRIEAPTWIALAEMLVRPL